MSESEDENRAYEQELEEMVARLESMMAACEENGAFWQQKAENLIEEAKRDDRLIEDLNLKVESYRAAERKAQKKVINLEIANDKLENDLRMVEIRLDEKDNELKEVKENFILLQMDLDFFKESKNAEILALKKKLSFLQSFQYQIEQSTEVNKDRAGSRRGSIDKTTSSRIIDQIHQNDGNYDTKEKLIARARNRVSIDPTSFINMVNTSTDTIVDILGSMKKKQEKTSKATIATQTENLLQVRSFRDAASQVDDLRASKQERGVQVNFDIATTEEMPKLELSILSTSVYESSATRLHTSSQISAGCTSKSMRRQMTTRRFNLDDYLIDEEKMIDNPIRDKVVNRSPSTLSIKRLLESWQSDF